MGGTVNATDNFNIPADTPVAVTLDPQAMAVEAAETQAAGHVHGPNCGHDHAHEHEHAEPTGKYANINDVPALDLVTSFKTNNDGPLWRTSPKEMLTNIAFHSASIPAGKARVCFLNNEAYKFLLSVHDFHKRFQPSPSLEHVKMGLIGLFANNMILASDALWAPEEQVTLHKAIYFCDEVLADVQELLIETAEPAAKEPVAEDVLDKEKGRCINCLDTGAVAGDPDQVCGCPAGNGSDA